MRSFFILRELFLSCLLVAKTIPENLISQMLASKIAIIFKLLSFHIYAQKYLHLLVHLKRAISSEMVYLKNYKSKSCFTISSVYDIGEENAKSFVIWKIRPLILKRNILKINLSSTNLKINISRVDFFAF